MITVNKKVVAEHEKHCSDKCPSVGLFHLQFFSLSAACISDKNQVQIVCCGNVWAANYGRQVRLAHHEHADFSTSVRCANLLHNQPLLLPLVHAASAVPFLLDYEPSVWHSYGCSPASSLGLLLSGNSSFTELRAGEQPIGTLHLVLATLDKLSTMPGAVIHSDQGSQYTNKLYHIQLEKLQIQGSHSRKGNCLDNACVESFFSHLKAEVFLGKSVQSKDETSAQIEKYGSSGFSVGNPCQELAG